MMGEKAYIIQENAKRLVVKKKYSGGCWNKQVQPTWKRIHVHVQRRDKELKARG